MNKLKNTLLRMAKDKWTWIMLILVPVNLYWDERFNDVAAGFALGALMGIFWYNWFRTYA